MSFMSDGVSRGQQHLGHNGLYGTDGGRSTLERVSLLANPGILETVPLLPILSAFIGL